VLPRSHSWIKGSLLLREGDGKEMEDRRGSEEEGERMKANGREEKRRG